jgi:hypothetical protein
LDNILSGHSPHLRPDSPLASLGLAMIGFLLVVGTFHFTFWANRTTSVMEQSEKFVAFDHFGQMMKIVELDNYFGATNNNGQSSAPDLEPQLVYLEQLSRLEIEYHYERTLPSRMNELLVGFNPLGVVRDRVQRRICQPGIFESAPTVAASIGCPISLQEQDKTETKDDNNDGEAEDESSETIATNAEDPGSADEIQVSMSQNDIHGISEFKKGLGQIDVIREETMKAAGRNLYGTYTRSQRVVEGLQQRLREQLNIVHLWALPILYGALGSIVYCMWRVLNPNVSGLGFIHPVMRTIFAGLAALTFSMLLVPSNILSVGVDLNRPLIYLLSFVFGYSIEAFVNTLNVLNTYVSGSIAVKGKRQT